MRNLVFFATAALMVSPAWACAALPALGEANKKLEQIHHKISSKQPLAQAEKEYFESYKKDWQMVEELRKKSPTECGKSIPQDAYNEQINALYKKWKE